MTLLMFLAFLEILARRVGSPDETRNIEMDFNADLMWQLRDDPAKGPEYRVNALGLRGPEPEPGDHLRILSTGDSSIYGHSVRIDEVFTSVIAARLEQARPSPAVEPLIGGIPGYSSYQSVRLLQRLGEAVRPDVVLIGNMWSDAFQSAVTDAEWAGELSRAYGPWTPITAPLALLSERSALARNVRGYLHDRFFPAKERANEVGWMHLTKTDPGMEDPSETTESLLRREQAAAAAGAIDAEPGADGSSEDAAPSKELAPSKGKGKARRPPATARVPLVEYEANLHTLAAEVRDLGALPVFLMLPHPRDGAATVDEVEYGKAMEYRVVMRRVAEAEHVPLVDVRDWFARHPRDGTRFADDIHPNAVGHADIAAAALEVLAADPALAQRLHVPPDAFAGG